MQAPRDDRVYYCRWPEDARAARRGALGRAARAANLLDGLDGLLALQAAVGPGEAIGANTLSGGDGGVSRAYVDALRALPLDVGSGTKSSALL